MNAMRLLLFLFGLLMFAQVNANRVYTTPQEFKAMDPACQAIGMGEINGKFWAEALGNDPILDKPENAMAKGAGWFHHYCWGKLSKLRYYSAKTADQRSFAIRNWRSEMNFIVGWTGERAIKWKYMPLIHMEIAQSYLFEKNYGQAIVSGEKAIELDPDYDPAYVILSDAYAGVEKRQKALEVVTEGLKHAPDSKALKRRYRDFGGKMPYPQPYTKPELPVEAVSTVESAQPSVPIEAVVPPVKNAQPEETNQPKNSTNPYCRFCP